MNKFLALLVLMIAAFAPTQAQARARYFNYCQEGNQPAFVAAIQITTPLQRTFPGCTVQVNISGTSTPATLYSDDGGTPLANPLTADLTTGFFDWYADNGTYDLLFSGGEIVTPYTWAAVSIVDPTTIPNVINYIPGAGTLAQQCTAAKSANLLLVFSTHVTGVSSQTCTASTWFLPGGSIQPASAAVVQLPVPFSCSPNSLDVSVAGVGSIILTGDPLNNGANPRCFGATGNGSTDDTTAMQATITATQVGGQSTASVRIPQGSYKITTGLLSTSNGANIYGEGKLGSTLLGWFGSTNGILLTMQGFHYVVSNLYIEDGGTGWKAGFDHEGSQSEINNVFADCNFHPGDAIGVGLSNLAQADQLLMNKITAADCTTGRGVNATGPNSGNNVSIVMNNPTIGNNWIGIQAANNAVQVFGAEMDTNTINIIPGSTSTYVSGIRTEGSSRMAYTGSGGFTSGLNLNAWNVSSVNQTRPTATGAISASGTSLVLSANLAPGWASGDIIDIAGAGVAGGNLVTRIGNCTTATTCAVDQAASTTVTAGAVTLDSGNQTLLDLNSSGPFIVTGGTIGSPAAFSIFRPNAAYTILGNVWTNALPNHNPFGLDVTGSGELTAAMIGNFDTITNRLLNWLPNTQTTGPYLGTDTSGSVNLVTVATVFPRIDGISIKVRIAHSLQVGANQLTYNGATSDIKKNTNIGDLTTGYSALTWITFTFSNNSNAWLVDQ